MEDHFKSIIDKELSNEDVIYEYAYMLYKDGVIKKDHKGFDHPNFLEIKKKHKETLLFQDNNNTDIEEGVEQCYKCGSNRTLSTIIKTRSSDEGMTVKIVCLNKECKKITFKNS